MKDKYAALSKFIEDKNLTGSQKEVLEGFREYLKENKPHYTKKYLRDLFWQANQFAHLVKKPFEECTGEDLEKFYQHCIGEREISRITIEGYESRLRTLFEYIFYTKRQYDKYSDIELVIKNTFKKRIIEARRKLNEADIDKSGKIKTVERYLNEGIKRPVYENGKLVKYQQVSLSEKQQITLNNYYRRLRSGTFCKIGVHNLVRTIGFLFKFGEFIDKPYEEVTEEDLINFFFKLEGENKSIATIDGYKHIIKVFYTYFLHKESLVKNISLSKKRIRKKESEMLSPSEIRRLVEVCDHPRDKCILMVTYDGAFRQGEVLNIQLKDIENDEHGYKITVTGKTGTRKVRLIDAVPYLNDWLNYHPFKNDQEAYLFINLKTYGRKLKENGIAQIFNRAKKLAGFDKRVYPHLLRHSRLNQLGKEGFNERDLRIFAGWSAESKMPDTYIHYDEKHVDKKMLEKRGIFTDKSQQKIEEERKKLEPKNCPRCKSTQPADAKYCNCGMVLDSKEAVNLEVVREKANIFTQKLLQEPLVNADLSKGIMEALLQKVLTDPQKIEEIREILKQ